MKFVIVGGGKIGSSLVERLFKENQDIIVVDKNNSVVENLVNKFDILGICGNGNNRDTLMEAGVDKVDFFIATTPRDELNILCCALAKKLGARYTMARVRDPDYFDEGGFVSNELGINTLINPEYRAAEEIAQILKFPSAIDIEPFANGQALIAELKVEQYNPIIGKSIMDIIKEYQVKVLFNMVTRGSEIFIPKGDFVIEEGDHIHVTATEKELREFCRSIHVFKQGARSVFIIGGGKISYYLASILNQSNIKIKIIDNDRKRCEELAEGLPSATILCGDGTDHDVLAEERLSDADACVALTGFDEENIIVGLYAQTQKVSKIIVKIDRDTLVKMVPKLGIETIITPQNSIANQVISIVRNNQADLSSGVTKYYKLHDSVEAIEFLPSDSFKYFDTPLKDIRFKKNVLVSGIAGEQGFIIPSGDSVIKKGDKVLIVTTEKNILSLTDAIKYGVE